ncbi:hypothetical protein [Micromonospora sp. NPDC047527]|uniref:hypothetical protein n=1 Tax=Micromonospora sp. NPDC047527 TaxID=3155144 RepID=UPI0033D2BAF0
MVPVTRGGVTLSVVTVLAGPLLAAALAHGVPRPIDPVAATRVLAAPALGEPGLGALAGPFLTAPGLTAPGLKAPGLKAPGLTASWLAAPAPDASQPSGLPVAAPQPPPPVDVFVEVSPSTVQPGYLVGIRASCRDNSVGATVVSDAFGAIGVQPQRGVLTAAPMVRERTRPGNYRVKLECRDGETASTMLQVVKKVPDKPSRGPATGFGGTSGGMTGKLLLPGGAALTIAGLVVAVLALRRPRTVRGTARR